MTNTHPVSLAVELIGLAAVWRRLAVTTCVAWLLCCLCSVILQRDFFLANQMASLLGRSLSAPLASKAGLPLPFAPLIPRRLRTAQRSMHMQLTAAMIPQQQQPARVSSVPDGLDAVITNQASPTTFKQFGITGDGSCMFRACVQGQHQLQHAGQVLSSREEQRKALELRRAVVEELRKNKEDMEPFLPGIAEDFNEYCEMMSQPGVWGGEPELLMTSRVLQRPICVYQPGSSSWGFGSSSPQLIVTYGDEYRKAATPMHLLWSGAHYDLLVPQPTSKL
eukprot:GHRR01006339.1.p1 GENE.GHRR01006339.1~~GHRR01006339.1.p1  ORF type:complete len:279 (+),score=66.16 GHRR01006339.1:80-916(+)